MGWRRLALFLSFFCASHAQSTVVEEIILNEGDVGNSLGPLGVGEGLPVAIAKGMGDACLNPGMKQITQVVGQRLKVYSACIPDGDSQPEDTVNGFLLNMNKLVENFAERVRKDERLRDGFNAIGFSQGNLVIRGYIEKFNNPPVKRFLSVHGPLAGVGSICNPGGLSGFLCRKGTDLVGEVAYSSYVQEHVAQSNFLKDPTELDLYTKGNIFLPFINNEVNHPDSEKFKKNFVSIEKLILVKAEKDTMVYPAESEWFGFFEDGGFEAIQPMNATTAYKSDSFGLKTLVESGKVSFELTNGSHLQFSLQELYGWLDKYFK